MYECEFCRELSNVVPSAKELDRVLFHTNMFTIVPSVGPLHDHHLLICSNRHARGLHELYLSEVAELKLLFQSLEKVFCQLHGTNFVAFENGTGPDDAPGCSIVHYHMHVVPVARSVSMNDIRERFLSFSQLDEAARHACVLKSYLFVKSPKYPFQMAERAGLPSQHMRRAIASINGCPEWDWRRTGMPFDWSQTRTNLQPIVDRLHSEFSHASYDLVAD